MTRSVWKAPLGDGHLLKMVEKTRASGRNDAIKIWSRRSTILPEFVGLTFAVHDGRTFLPVLVTEAMIGQRFGDFAPIASNPLSSHIKRNVKSDRFKRMLT